MSVDYNTPEYLTVTESGEIITTNIRQDLGTVAQRLHSLGVISRTLLEEIQEVTGIQSRNKAAKVVSAVSDKVLLDPMLFWEFVEVLLTEDSSFKEGKNLRDSCAAKGGTVPKGIDDKIKEFEDARKKKYTK